MKKIIISCLALCMLGISVLTAQVEEINLEQIEGAFTTESVTLVPGQYQFNISNTNVDHEVGFVLVPKGKYEPEHHIKDAYVTAPVPTGKTSPTNVVTLKAGEYEYFCPLNPTEKYDLTVVEGVETLKLEQVPGEFQEKGLTVDEGTYQFQIANNGVDHEVGFVLVPKGKYDPAHHIKAAYVKAPVADGTNAKTGILELEAGEYEYFCPLNPTPKYSLTVR